MSLGSRSAGGWLDGPSRKAAVHPPRHAEALIILYGHTLPFRSFERKYRAAFRREPRREAGRPWTRTRPMAQAQTRSGGSDRNHRPGRRSPRWRPGHRDVRARPAAPPAKPPLPRNARAFPDLIPARPTRVLQRGDDAGGLGAQAAPATSHGLEARLKSPDSTRSEPFQEPTASRAASPLPSRAAGCSQVETAKTLPAPGDGAGLRATCPDRSMGARAGPASRRPAACRTVRAGGPMPRLGGPEPEPPTPPCRRRPLTPACEDRRAPRLARPLPTGPETAARTLNDQAETRSSGRGTRNGSA